MYVNMCNFHHLYIPWLLSNSVCVVIVCSWYVNFDTTANMYVYVCTYVCVSTNALDSLCYITMCIFPLLAGSLFPPTL